MPADFGGYVDMTIDDLSPTDIYLAAQEYAQMVLPEFNLRQGTVEDAMFQAMAYVQMISQTSINRLPNRLTEGMLRLLGVQRSEGTRAQLEVVVTLNENIDFTIPAGTAFTYERKLDIDVESESFVFRNSSPIQLTATLDGSMPTTTATLYSEQVGYGLEPEENQEIVLQRIFTDVESVVYNNVYVGGTEPETDTEYFARGTSYIGRLSSGLSTGAQIENYVLTESTDVQRCKVYGLTSVNDLLITATDYPGSMVVFVNGFDGPLPSSRLTELAQEIDNVTVPGLQLNVLPFSSSAVSVTVNLSIDIDYTESITVNSLTQRLLVYLSIAGYRDDLDGVYASDIAYEIARTPGVAVVSSVTIGDATGNSEYTVSGDNLLFKEKGQLPSLDISDLTINVV